MVARWTPICSAKMCSNHPEVGSSSLLAVNITFYRFLIESIAIVPQQETAKLKLLLKFMEPLPSTLSTQPRYVQSVTFFLRQPHLPVSNNTGL